MLNYQDKLNKHIYELCLDGPVLFQFMSTYTWIQGIRCGHITLVWTSHLIVKLCTCEGLCRSFLPATASSVIKEQGHDTTAGSDVVSHRCRFDQPYAWPRLVVCWCTRYSVGAVQVSDEGYTHLYDSNREFKCYLLYCCHVQIVCERFVSVNCDLWKQHNRPITIEQSIQTVYLAIDTLPLEFCVHMESYSCI